MGKLTLEQQQLLLTIKQDAVQKCLEELKADIHTRQALLEPGKAAVEVHTYLTPLNGGEAQEIELGEVTVNLEELFDTYIFSQPEYDHLKEWQHVFTRLRNMAKKAATRQKKADKKK